jgi:tetratricopeptide (TPR) repeat protein
MAIFSTFNPSAMPSELIEGIFVQRENIAERLVDIFEESVRQESKHHVLLVGPRGIGKSHLVSLVYHRLKAKEDLADKFCIAYLREDEWGITSFLDLLLRILDAASEESGLERPASISDIAKLGRAQAEEQVWRHLQDLLRGRPVFLVIENLDAVFEKIGEQGQRQWRALMQTYPQWAILASTPALFSGISRQVSPFYGFFEVIHLQPLSLDDAIALLKRLAHLNNDEKTAVFLDSAEGRARVRAVQHIAGGNHRIFVLFYSFLNDFLNRDGSKPLVEPLLKTVDALTPYYQSQMARLSPQQQKFVSFLCEHRRPATVTTIAASCFTTHQTAASQLKQLLTARYVRVDRIGRESFYELTEPLLRICVEAKTHRDRPLFLLVDFIRYWFSREELERKLSSTSEPDAGKPYFLAALKEYDAQDAHVHLSPQIGILCVALSRVEGSHQELQACAQQLAELSKIAEDWTHYTRALIWLGRSQEAIPILENRLQNDPNNVEILRSLANAYARADSKEFAQEVLDRAIRLSPNSAMLFLDKGDLLAFANRDKEALDAYEEAALFDIDVRPFIAVHKARALLRLDSPAAARESLYPFLDKGKTIRGIFLVYGLALGNEEKHTEALKYFDKAVNAFENDSGAWGSKGIALCSLGMYEEALEALDRSLALSPGDKNFQHYQGQALFETRQFALAADTLPPEVLSHNIFHQLLKILNSHPRQGRLQQKLLRLNKADDSEGWKNAFVGGLIEFASLASEFSDQKDLDDLQIWSSALHELFANEQQFSILLTLFNVLTRVKVFNDRKALLELPREQRLLLVGEKEEEDFLNAK